MKAKLLIGLVVFGAAVVNAQETVILHGRPWAPNVVVPQIRAFAMSAPAAQVTQVAANVRISEQVSATTLDISLRNPGGTRLEAELLVPVADGAVVRGFDFQGASREPTAQLLPKDEARRIYQSLVSKVRDPALLEFAGHNLVRSSVFPIEPFGTQKVRLTYEQILTADGNRVDYTLPRTEALDYQTPWKVTVHLSAKVPISTVYSPSHMIETKRINDSSMTIETVASAARQPGPFRLSYLLQHDGVTASLMAYPDPKVGGGYFLLLAGLPARPSNRGDQPAIKREVTLVIDRSGSMHGEKMEQAREAALQVLSSTLR